jgi:hypothetical protein
MKRAAMLLLPVLVLLDSCGNAPSERSLVGVYRFDPPPDADGAEAASNGDFSALAEAYQLALSTFQLTLNADGTYIMTVSDIQAERGRWRIEGDCIYLHRAGDAAQIPRPQCLIVRDGTLIVESATDWIGRMESTPVPRLTLRKQ